MSDIASVVDRIYRDYLWPPGEQPARFLVNDTGGISAADTTLVVDTGMLNPEEEDLIGAGTLLEIGSELVLVEAVTGTAPALTFTIRRGMYDTTAAVHADDTDVFLLSDDHVSRQSVFVAVSDAVEALWPDLWTVGVEETFSMVEPIELPAAAGEVLDLMVHSAAGWDRIGGWTELQDFPLSTTSNAVQIYGVSANCPVHIYYKKKPTRPAAEADTLASLGVEAGWVKIVVAQAVAALVSRVDLSKATVEFITQSLESEGFQPGEGADIRNSLLQFADFQIRPLKRQLVLKHDRVVVDTRY